jgi:hypothetical protein
MSLFRWMHAALLPALLIIPTSRASAQWSGAYVGYSVGRTDLDAPSESFPEVGDVRLRWVEAGWVTRLGLSLDARGTHFRESTRSYPAPGVPQPEAPTTVGVRATLVEGGIGYRPPLLRFGPLRPLVGVGLTWARVVDSWESDTPEERRTTNLAGANASAGVEAGLGPFALVGRATYRALSEDRRPGLHIGIDRFSWDAGVRLRF